MKIEIKTGDITTVRPKEMGIIIGHCCNSEGAWGAGFVLAVNQISLAPSAAYKAWAKEKNGNIPLGIVQFVEAIPGLFVANMIAQNGIKKTQSDGCLVDYVALERCLKVTFTRAVRLPCEVHLPAGIGSGLAGGDRDKIHGIIRSAAEVVEQHSQASKLIETATGEKPELRITLWEYTDTNSPSFIPGDTTRLAKRYSQNPELLDELKDRLRRGNYDPQADS